jgi:hypothetical protein
MSWDIYVLDFPPDIETPGDVPEDFRPGPLMSREALIEGISELVPGADFSDPTWGRLDGPDYSIEVNIGEDDPVESFALQVSGGDRAVGVVADILDHFRLRAIDTGSEDGGFFDREGSVDQLRAWRAYRDQVIRPSA